MAKDKPNAETQPKKFGTSAGVLLTFMKEIVDLPGDVIMTYNAGDVSLEA